MRWEPFEPRSPNAGAGHSADAVKKAVSPGLEWRSWRTTGSQSRESFIPGPTSVSPSGTRGKSRMHKGARTDPCGGRGVTRAPTATRFRARLIEFGRHAANNRKQRGLGKPETFNFLGMSFICGN